jgi:imidazole glycerol-phosphate synthase subunit HisH
MSGERRAGRARVAILDYGMGNLRSVEKALERSGADAVITADREVAAAADGLLLPGVGAFPKAIARVRELGLDLVIGERLEAGTPVLGICLGYQLVFESSTELGGAEGLGLVAGDVDGLRAPGLKVPHIGWEPVRWERDCELTDGIPDATPFYFVHSFTPRPAAPGDVLGSAEHGERFACAIARPPLYGVQFHPEKSSVAGLRLLRNFAAICAAPPEASGVGGGGARLRPADAASTSRLNSGGPRLRPADSASR